jgi:hypothetical protein
MYIIRPTLSPLVRHIYGQKNNIPETALPCSGMLKMFKSAKISGLAFSYSQYFLE